jgi:t-SNARE complex subunit (syntaxin)
LKKDYAKGYGGKYGLEVVKDKNAAGYSEKIERVGTNYQPIKPDVKRDIKALKNHFENFVSETAKIKAAELRQERSNFESKEKEQQKV